MADNPFGGVPRGVVQVVAGATAAYQTFSTAREAAEWFQEGAKLVKRARLTQPQATPRMSDDPYGPTSSSVRTRSFGLSTRVRKDVKACCESILEEKFLGDSRAVAAVPTAAVGGAVQCVNDMNQGTAEGTRVGSQVTNKWLLMKGFCSLPQTAVNDVYRLIVVADHECFGVACTLSQILQTQSVFDIENFQNRSRFRILVDKTIPLVNPTTPAAGASSPIIPFEIKIPLNFRTAYNGNAGTIGDIVKNSICVVESTQSGLVQSAWFTQLVYLDG